MKQEKQISIGGNINPAGEVRTIVITQTKRGGVDIDSLMKGIRSAENVDYPNRVKLYDIYSDLLMTDGHLNAVINKRKAAILNAPIEFQRNGKVDEQIQEQLRSPWFYNCMADLWDSIMWGCTAVQFFREGKWLNYVLVPRKHIDPVRGLIMRRQSDITGIPISEYSDMLVVGKPNDLGLLARVMPYCIYKRNGIADWAQYAELYGQPLREGEYDGWDDEAREKLIDDLYNLGKGAIFLHPAGTKITLHESQQKGASADLYNTLINCCNDEISKTILGNTLTTQAGEKGTQALGTVQKKAEEGINNMDRQYMLNILNYELSDILSGFGFNMAGGEFVFKMPQNINLTERINIDNQLRNSMGLPIDDEYLYDTYGVTKPNDYDKLKQELMAQPKQPVIETSPTEDDSTKLEKQDKKRERKMLNRLNRFFARALGRQGALDW